MATGTSARHCVLISSHHPRWANAVSGRPLHFRAACQESSRQTPPPDPPFARGFWGVGALVQPQSFSCQA